MGKQRKTYSESFKRKVAIDGIRMNGNFAEVAAKYDITPSMAYNWCVDLENGKDTREMKQLRRKLDEAQTQLDLMAKEIGKKQLEVELLKKKTSRR